MTNDETGAWAKVFPNPVSLRELMFILIVAVGERLSEFFTK